MVENSRKLEAAFLAGRMDAKAERQGEVDDGLEELFRMVLSEGDCLALARFSKVLFRAPNAGRAMRAQTPVLTFPLVVTDGGSNGENGGSH
jgi:hypothetical protein